VTEERRTLCLVALDDLAAGSGPSIDVLVAGLSASYGLPVRVQDPGTPPAFTSRVGSLGSRQILSTDVMRWLRQETASDAYCLVALTRTDLYPDPAWNFVFGEASLIDRVGVFSFARYEPYPLAKDAPPEAARERRALLLRRAMKVLTHEVGHILGLRHCVHHACLMNGCNHLNELDRTPDHLCPVCLRKVLHTTRTDVLARYAAIERFDREHGLVPEADFAKARRDYAAAGD